MLMNLPFSLPAWMPAWVFLLLALPVLLYVLAFLLMPFSVFGVKARIESLEAQVDSLHEDLRMMAMRASGVLPPASTELDHYDNVPNFGRLKKSQRDFSEPEAPVFSAPAKPALPQVEMPAPIMPTRERLSPAAPAPAPRPARRMEPRLD
jgi:hypothetical protein